MTTALTLLMTAMQLLTMVANTPSLSTEFKNQAIQIANQAIVVAQDEIGKNQTATPVTVPTIQPVQTLQIPTFSGTINSMNNLSIRKFCVKDDNVENQNGLFCEVTAMYTSQNGGRLLNEALTFTSDGQGKFVNYQSPEFVSTTTNQLIIKTKRLNNSSGQKVTYSQPNMTEPTFTVSVGELQQSI